MQKGIYKFCYVCNNSVHKSWVFICKYSEKKYLYTNTSTYVLFRFYQDKPDVIPTSRKGLAFETN